MTQMITKTDWEDFMALGRAPRNIRGDILRSWERSIHRPIAQLKMAPLLSGDEVHLRRVQAGRLHASARRALQRAGSMLADTKNILLVCDRDGVVLDSAGDATTLDRGIENHLHVGGRWAEDRIGTNAIGTAIALRRAIVVRETEHFCEEIQRWSCAATPVFEPGTGRLLGVVDISWPSDLARASAAALSGAFALQIESELAGRLTRDREILREHIQFRRLRRGNEPLLVLDRAGTPLFSSDEFARFCEDDGTLDLLRERLPDVIDKGPETIAAAMSGCLPDADFDIVEARNEPIGVVVALRRRSGRQRPSDAPCAAGPGLAAQVERLARTTIPVLIEGEIGTGRVDLARRIHNAGASAVGPFQRIDCARLSPAELRDAFDSAIGGMPHGTLCLENPGGASAEARDRLFQLAGDALHHGVRIVTLSLGGLYENMRRGSFSSELYFRIAGARLEVPPLRAREGDDILSQMREQVRRRAQQSGGRELRFTRAAMEVLRAYSWPGNLREMENLVVALDVLSPTGLIDVSSLPPEVRRTEQTGGEQTLRELEKAEIRAAIEAAEGNLSQAARSLGIARSTLYVKLEGYGIPRPLKH